MKYYLLVGIHVLLLTGLGFSVPAHASIIIDRIIETEEVCNLSNGTITIIAQGGIADLSYSIDGGFTYQPSNFFDNLESADYLIIVTDGTACTEVRPAQIRSSAIPRIDMEYNCEENLALISIDLIPFPSGTPPFTYEWSGPAGTYNTEDLSSVPAGTYDVTVIDRDGCSIDSSFTIPVCCSLHLVSNTETTIVSCMDDLKEVTTETFETVDNSMKIEYLKSLLDIEIQDQPCKDISVQIALLEELPINCADPMVVTKSIEVSDGVTKVEVLKTYFIESFSGIQLAKGPDNLSLECGLDTESIIQEYLATDGGIELSICSEEVLMTNSFETSSVELDCNATLPITFTLTDMCGNVKTSTAMIILDDSRSPELSCPLAISMDTQVDLFPKLDEWLSTVVVSDNCSEVIVTNDLEMAEMDQTCSSSHDIEFVATDLCGNTSSCRTKLNIVTANSLAISCPESVDIGCTEIKPDLLIYQLLDSMSIETSNEFDVDYEYSVDIYNISCDFVYIFDADVVVSNACNERAECRVRVDVEPEVFVYIPNTFSPDVNNEKHLTVYGNIGVKEIEVFHIYNRWGKIVHEAYNFQANDESMGWNGRINNESHNMEIYTYHVVCKSVSGRELKYAGSITLLK